jgi:hypothetical protein
LPTDCRAKPHRRRQKPFSRPYGDESAEELKRILFIHWAETNRSSEVAVENSGRFLELGQKPRRSYGILSCFGCKCLRLRWF